MIDPAAALAAAERLRSHLPPYYSALALALAGNESDEGDAGIAHRSEEAGTGQH